MSDHWKCQLRIYLADGFAEMSRRDSGSAALTPLTDILARHHATMKCQFDAFAEYVAEAEKLGTEHFPLYRWTKVTLEDATKKTVVSRERPSRRASIR